jgi:CheY-like chemotaxis protein
LIITDLVMFLDNKPGARFDGREVAIAARTISPRTRIIIVSAYFGQITDNAGLLEYDAFIHKSNRSDELLKVIQELLDRTKK